MPLAHRVLAFAERKTRVLDLAKDQWREIFLSVGISENHLVKPNRPCPICGGVDRFSFTNRAGRGSYLCRKCGAGDGFDLIMRYTNCTFVESLEKIERFFGIEQVPEISSISQDSSDKKRLAYLQAWEEARPIQHADAVHSYLMSRGLYIGHRQKDFSEQLRCHRGMPYITKQDGADGLAYPVMLARVVNSQGIAINMHRTYLQDGFKAPVESPKKMMAGSLKGGVVQLQPMIGDTIGYAEGIETALAAHELFHIPVWAALTADNLAQLEWVPPQAKKIRIFSDNDATHTGQKAALEFARTWILRGKEVEVWLPLETGKDFLDIRVELAKGTTRQLFRLL